MPNFIFDETKPVVRDDEQLPSVPEYDWDWSLIVELLSEKTVRYILAFCTGLGILLTLVSTIFTTLLAQELVEPHTAFVTLTVISIILGVVTTISSALGYKRASASKTVEIPAQEFLQAAEIVNGEDYNDEREETP